MPEATRGERPGIARRIGAAFSSLTARILYGRDIAADLRLDRERLSVELSRRLGELYSLQELTQILSASLQFDTVVAEVARYAMRALDASGAVVLLAFEEGGEFRVVAAKGFLAGLLGENVDPESGGLVLETIRHEKAEMKSAPPGAQLVLFGSATARAVVATPLRAHGITVGAIAVADKLMGEFTREDSRLLSTAATHAAVVLANARLFELVRVGKEQWEATFDALGEGIAVVDSEGTLRRANTTMAALAGVEIRRIVGRNLVKLLFGEAGDNGQVTGLLGQLGAGARGGAPLVIRSEHLGRMLRIAGAPLRNPTLEAAAVLVVEDITDQKRLEGQLIQSEKLAAVGTLVSGVAHELNNPLTSIAGLSEFLLERGVGGDPAREHLRVICDQAERASRIVRNLLSFARKAPAERSVIDLGDIVQRTVQLMGYELRQADITIETAVETDLPTVLGNRDQLQQVVLNLITNAAYALAQQPAGAKRLVRVEVRREDDCVVARVIDNGPGMTSEIAAQIFDPFFTTKPPGEGTGLGLFLSFGIAESHGGSLGVESAGPGSGATFTLTLPPGGDAAAAATEPVRQSRAVQGGGRRILVADGDPAVRRMVSVLFAHDGHRVDAVAGGDEALALAGSHSYDLVIVDRHAIAAGVPLLEALRRAKPEWSGRILVAVPGQRTDGLGPSQQVLSKPFNLKDLREAAEQAWSRK